MAEASSMKQFISDEGVFNAAAMQDFSRSVGLHDCGRSYQVVAVLGPQSIGKSTLLNCLFGTNFTVMNAKKNCQTTQGIWIAEAKGRKPLTLVLDLEGTDSRERGEDGTTFEKQSSLFTLAVADVVLININYKDIGRENASGRPLFKSVFQAMVRLAGHDPIPTNKTLIYVIRDQAKDSSFEDLEHNLQESIRKVWDSIIKPKAYKDTPLAEIFNVEVAALPHYEREEAFKEQVAQLGQRYFPSGGGAAAGDPNRLPYSEFYSSADGIWQRIREDRDLDLPAYRIMVATVRCEEIAEEKLRDIDEDCIALKVAAADADLGVVPIIFAERAMEILNTHLSKYDEESQYFDEQVRVAKRRVLESKALQRLYPSYTNTVSKLHSILLLRFKEDLEVHLDRGDGFAAAVSICTCSCIQEFDRQCSGAAIEQANWDAWDVRRTLVGDMKAHALHVRDEKLQHKLRNAQDDDLETFVREVDTHFQDAREDPWPIIRSLMDSQCAESGPVFKSLFEGFELDRPTAGKMAKDLKEEATRLVRRLAEARAVTAVSHLLKRFYQVNPEAKDEAKTEALDECVKLLSIMAVMRVDEGQDKVQRVLHSALRYGHSDAAGDLTSNTWLHVPPENTLINPYQCRTLWNEFVTIMEHTNSEVARRAQEGGWKRWIFLGVTAAGVCAYITTAFPEMTTGVAILASFWVVSEIMRPLGSLALGLFKKARHFYSYCWRSRSTIIPIIISLAEELYRMYEAAQRRQQVNRYMLSY